MTPSASTFASATRKPSARQPNCGPDAEPGVADLSQFDHGYDKPRPHRHRRTGLSTACPRSSATDTSNRVHRRCGLAEDSLPWSSPFDAFLPDANFGPRPFTETQLREIVSRHLVVDEVRPARAWVNVPRTLPIGFEYRNVTTGPTAVAYASFLRALTGADFSRRVRRSPSGACRTVLACVGSMLSTATGGQRGARGKNEGMADSDAQPAERHSSQPRVALAPLAAAAHADTPISG